MEQIPTPESKLDLTQFEALVGPETAPTDLTEALTDDAIGLAIENLDEQTA